MKSLRDLRIVYIGCVEFSRHCLLQVLRSGGHVASVFTLPPEKASFNADYADLSGICAEYGIPLHYVTSLRADSEVDRIRSYDPDILFVWGWSHLIPDAVLQISRLGAIGSHPALLPSNRGRHPLIWAIQLGLPSTGLTFFWMNAEADAGDILAQKVIPIGRDETAITLYEKIKAAATEMIPEFLPKLASGHADRIPQDASRANSWRKRRRNDGRIDFRMTADAIERLVRALGRPYPGAHVEWNDREVRVWRAYTRPLPAEHCNQEYGRVVAVQDGEITVRADQGLIVLAEHEFDPLPEKGTHI